MLMVIGCRGQYGDLGKVTGKVTLGGQPLEGALVMFSPVNGKSPSSGRTDATGTYTLVYTRTGTRIINGAEVGEHIITISTYQGANEDGEPPTPEVPEKVPFKYRDGAELLKREVKRGNNSIDLALDSGPVDNPQTKTKAKKTSRACY